MASPMAREGARGFGGCCRTETSLGPWEPASGARCTGTSPDTEHGGGIGSLPPSAQVPQLPSDRALPSFHYVHLFRTFICYPTVPKACLLLPETVVTVAWDLCFCFPVFIYLSVISRLKQGAAEAAKEL